MGAAKRTDHLDFVSVFATELRHGDNVIVKAGDVVLADGEVIEGIVNILLNALGFA